MITANRSSRARRTPIRDGCPRTGRGPAPREPGRPSVTAGYQAYHHNAVTTAAPEQLVVMLFDGALRFSRRAVNAYEAGQLPQATQAVGRVTAIVNELNATLDTEAGGDIARNLRSIYGFVNRHLLEAVRLADPNRVRQASALLAELREAFAEASKEVRAA
jgi:flagellar secretion chaperone FliS